MVGIALVLCMAACGSANAEALKLSPAPNSEAASKAAVAYAAQSKYASVETYSKQVFQISLGTEVLGTLVSGSGLLKNDDEGTENSTCFVALVEPDNKVALTPTVGVGEWDAVSCLSIEAVGTVSLQPKTGFGRLVIIHKGAAGRHDTGATVILAWNPTMGRLEIDLEASRKAELVPRTIAAVRKALQ